MIDTFLYVVEGDKESDEAIQLLKKCSLRFRIVVVGKEGNGKSMWRDLATTEIPSLQSPKGTFRGIEEIRQITNK